MFVEASVLVAVLGNEQSSDDLMQRLEGAAEKFVSPLDDETGREAVRASRLFGKGRHQAALNMDDCFAYACARQLGVPLLAKGNDFRRTDIELA